MKKLVWTSAFLSITLLLTGCAGIPKQDAPLGHNTGEPMNQFNGTWEGALKSYSAPNFISCLSPINFRIVVEGDEQARVFDQEDGQWEEVKPGFFHFFWPGGPQAIIASITSGSESAGSWLEGSTFTLNRLDDETLVAYWLRTVNNLDLPKEDKDHQFACGYTGHMRRIQVEPSKMSCNGEKFVASRRCSDPMNSAKKPLPLKP